MRLFIKIVSLLFLVSILSSCKSSSLDGSFNNDEDEDQVTSSCPTGYILIVGSSDPGSRATDFCISKYEMKAQNDSSGLVVDGIPVAMAGAATHTPVSVPEERPWGGVDFVTARNECASLGADYHLVTNAEWMTVARDIEDQVENWSSGVIGTGTLNTGHSDGWAIGGQDFLAATSDDNDPCYGTNNPDCTDTGHADYLQNRTHLLSNGEVIWDLAGNLNSWVDPDGTGTALAYDGQFGGEYNSVYQLNGTNPNGNAYLTLNFLAGTEHFYPKHEALYVGDMDDLGLGIIRKSDSDGKINKGLFRGGNYAESLSSQNRIGIFSAWISYDTTVNWSNLGFRCVYEP